MSQFFYFIKINEIATDNRTEYRKNSQTSSSTNVPRVIDFILKKKILSTFLF